MRQTCIIGRFALFVAFFAFGLCIVLPAIPQALAIETTWTGADSTSPTDFEVGNNWTLGTPANNRTGDTAVFGAKGSLPNPSLTSDREILGLEFRGTGWTLGGSGHTLTVGAGGIKTTHAAATITVIQPQVVLGANSTWTLGPGGSTLTLSGGLRSDAGNTLTLSSGTWYSPTLDVTGATSLAGDVVLQVSNLKIANYTENSITGNLRFNAGVLAINANLTRDLGVGAGQINFASGGQSGVTNYGSNRITVTLGDGLGGAANLKWGTGYFNPGNLVLSGYGAGTGGITLPNAIDLNGANRTFFNYRANYTAELTGLISNSGAGAAGISQHLNSNGTIYLANNANTFNGPIAMLGGVLRFDTIGNIGSGPSALGNPANAVNGRITLGHLCCNLVWTGTLLYTGADTVTTNRPIQLGGHAAIRSNGIGAITFTADMDPAINNTVRTFTLGGTNTGENTFAGRIVDQSVTYPTSVVKADAGTWVLSGDNVYTGTTSVSGGTLIATKPAALPGYNVSGRVSTTASGATLAIRAGAAGEWTSPEIATLLANATFAAGSNLGIDVTAGNAFEQATAIGGIQGMVKLGGGTLTLSGGNTYTGTTRVGGGTLIATKPAALPGYNVSGKVSTTASGATLAVRAGAAGEWTSLDIDTLLANTAFAAGSNLGIDVTAGNAFEQAGAIGGNRGLVKLGGGTLTLSGGNTYTGTTRVSGGTLLVNGTHTGGGAYTVQNGATLGGTGTIGGATSVNAGAFLAPGASIGMLAFSNDLALQANSTLLWEFLGADDDYDSITGPKLILPETGKVNLDILALTGYELEAGDSFTLFDGQVFEYGATEPFAFGADLNEYFHVTDNIGWWGTWELTAGSLVLTAVPEPGTCLMLTCLLVFGLLARRRS